MIRSIAFVLASLAYISLAGAEHRNTSPGVTVERCSGVDIDELQNAIAIEYQGQDDHRTMVTVVCENSTATVRVLGPSHPRGRIVDISIAGVDPVVLPRMLALMAVEMWTAPQAEAVTIAKPPIVREEPESWQPKYRRRLMVGAGLTSLQREIHAGSSFGNARAKGGFAALSLRVDWPVFARFGVFANYAQSGHVNLSGLEALGQPVRWARSEFGFYVPLVTQRYRISARYSAGRDSYEPRIQAPVSSEMAVLPNYYYDSIGFDFSYLANEKVTVGGSATMLFATNINRDFSSPRGVRWGMGLTYDVAKHVRLDGRVEAASMSQASSWASGSYSDVMTTLELGVQYLY